MAVVGAGIAGLAAAVELSSHVGVALLDRLPVAGGVLGYEADVVRELQERCAGAGVESMLGTTAIRWSARRLLTVGPDGVVWHDFDHLVYAGGGRPATQAELRIAGPRLAGVLPATVAIHFAEAGVILGHRVAVIGAGDWASSFAHAIAEQPVTTTVVADSMPSFRHARLISGWTPTKVLGTGRVNALVLERDGVEYRLSCDAVVLAAGARPLRNVDGAVLDTAEDVTFVQPIAESMSAVDTVEQARRLAAAAPLGTRIEVSV
jgi:NADPH-dependent 2,4-dienoyl-CoA reductase/sulfur reductase-like enzyme